jgi:Tfp pilus assembly protein PilN
VTVLHSESQVLAGGARVLPRVNLLPPEIAEQARLRKVQVGLGACLLGAVGVVGALYLSASHGVSSANAELAAAKETKTQLEGQVAKYRDVTAVYAQADAAKAQLRTAMWDEVRYSQILNDLSLSIPSNVWVKNFVVAPVVAAPGGAASTTAAPTVPPVTEQDALARIPATLRKAPLATVTVQGVGFAHDDVAAWLDSLASLKQYTSVYFSNSTEALVGPRKVVNFSSTATVNGLALSGRYTRQG